MPVFRSLPPPAGRRYGVRHVLLGTLPGRAIVIGIVLRVAVYIAGLFLGTLPGFLSVIDTAAGLALAIGAVYFLFKLIVLAKRHLLWRVRRKLMLSYVFVGFFPATLIVVFFLLCGFLLFYNFSSYLVQGHLRGLGDQAKSLAEGTALEIQRSGGSDVAGIVERRQANATGEFTGVSIAVVPAGRTCASSPIEGLTTAPARVVTAGPWAHVVPPGTIPSWIDCGGVAGVEAYSPPADDVGRVDAVSPDLRVDILVRAVAFPDVRRPGYAVVVDLPVHEQVTQQLRRDTGVEMRGASVALDSGTKARTVTPIAGRSGGEPVEHAAREPAGGGILGNLPSLVEYRDWNSGESGTLILSTQLSVGELYERISSAQGLVSRKSSQALLLILFVIGGLFIIIEIMALGTGLALAKSITGSVHELFTGTERVRHGDFTHKIAVTAQDQLGELAQSFNSMTASIEDLLREVGEKKRLEEELRIAREIQMSLLPQGALKMPGLSITALCVPAREVGGDYYDLFPIDGHRLGVLIADVSGKGTSAALYMAELKGLMLSLSQIHMSPRTLMVAADRIMANNLDARSFITMTYAIIDLRERTMTYARAGHTPVMYLPGAGATPGDARHVRILCPDGLVLGLKIDNGETFERLLKEQTIPLHDGDLYLLFTDGISEAMNEVDDCFGDERLGRILEDHPDLPSEELRERVLREIAAFVGDAPQHDDMTIILLKIDHTSA
jgi:sigma-B regulation protein RsbU (phosphoserine phosphatase)